MLQTREREYDSRTYERLNTFLSHVPTKSSEIKKDLQKLKPEVIETVDYDSIRNWTELNNAWKAATKNSDAVFNEREVIMILEETPKSKSVGLREVAFFLLDEFQKRAINTLLFNPQSFFESKTVVNTRTSQTQRPSPEQIRARLSQRTRQLQSRTRQLQSRTRTTQTPKPRQRAIFQEQEPRRLRLAIAGQFAERPRPRPRSRL